MWRLAFAIVCMIVGAALAESYIGRLPHHAGYFLVPVEDRVAVPLVERPRAYVIIVDGLRRDSAETMKVTKVLERSGQCRVSNQGSYTVSRPVYTLLSAGLEVDRAGSRNNDLTLPVAVESIWEVARESGLTVSGASHLSWLKQLFPRGFDRFRDVDDHAANVFTPLPAYDVNVLHPLYVDDAGHSFGALSPEYRAAVARADREIAGLLAEIDLERDVVILTADHGHRDAGGHGGEQPEIRDVLACFAGPNVRRRTDRAPFDGRVTAPVLATLLGLRFPRHMRAGEDGLDAIFDIATGDEAYLADRRAAVARFRTENERALGGWLGEGPPTWSRLYARQAGRAQLRLLAAAALALAGVAFALRGLDWRRRARTVSWLVFGAALLWAAHHLILGDFDYSVINKRERFILRAIAVSSVAALGMAASHRWIARGDLGRDFALALGVGLFANVAHVAVYGWPLGFPLPPQPMRYFPFFGGIALVCFGAVGVLLWLLARWRRAPR